MHKNVVRALLSHKNVGSTPGSTLRPMLAIGVVFLLKFVVVLQLRNHPLLQPDAGLDTTAYVDLARQVLAGNVGLGPGLYFVSPLYIYFLAGALAAFRSFTAVRDPADRTGHGLGGGHLPDDAGLVHGTGGLVRGGRRRSDGTLHLL